MASNDYHFLTHWNVPGATVEEVYAIISDVERLPHWWPSVYLSVTPVPGTGGIQGTGREYDLRTRGWLPYTLRWRVTVQEVHPPHGITIGASGDFTGRGVWSFLKAPAGVDVLFDWHLTADKPLLKILFRLFKPLSSANHAWAMSQGRISLLRELERRRDNASVVPPPPGPPTWQPFTLLASILTVVAGVAALAIRARNLDRR